MVSGLQESACNGMCWCGLVGGVCARPHTIWHGNSMTCQAAGRNEPCFCWIRYWNVPCKALYAWYLCMCL